ncbi:hypothetical protein RRG08_002029 [Elysia crispata]|uniref:Uncharacterized protein n=1 Tax=Elysia crispata TaxID=231223 RepID=A0AAE1B2Z4_9GAST|nr:hypothetical protein RRG08_002029 [Elysia crispata]
MATGFVFGMACFSDIAEQKTGSEHSTDENKPRISMYGIPDHSRVSIVKDNSLEQKQKATEEKETKQSKSLHEVNSRTSSINNSSNSEASSYISSV